MSRRLLLIFRFSLLAFLVIALLRQTPAVLSLDNRIYAVALEISYSQRWLVFLEGLTYFGNGVFVYSLVAAIALPFLAMKRNLQAAAYTFGMVVAFTLNPLIKLLYRLERPVSLTPFSDLTTYTFPSGHAFNSVILFFFLPRLGRFVFGERMPQALLHRSFAVAGMLAIGWSRILLGVHWFSDVLGGWSLGLVAATVLLAGLDRIHRTDA